MLPMLRSRFVTPTLFDSPFEPWSDLRREIDRLFDTVLWGERSNGFGWYGGYGGEMRWIPAMDIEEEDDRIRLLVEVPGVKPEDVEVTVENGVLTVSGEKKVERESGSNGSRTFERRYGRFERSVRLPENVDAEHITATHDNGVLTLELPKTTESRRRRIAIGKGNGNGIAQKRIQSASVQS